MEELGIPYDAHIVNIGRLQQFTKGFVSVNPNSKIPAAFDHAPADGGKPVRLFESGAMMIYLAEKYEKFIPTDPRKRAECLNWVMWQMANQGPKTGECGHFRRLVDDQGDQSYAVTRFTDEVNRFYGVLNNQLYNQRYLCGNEYTIADMICYPWTINWESQGQDVSEFKYFKRWFEELGERPAVQRGMAAGSELQNDFSKITKEEGVKLRALLYNQRARQAPETGGIEK